ncbi:MAG: Tat pathway signal sequence domain protein [Pseudomonadota bacterium]
MKLAPFALALALPLALPLAPGTAAAEEPATIAVELNKLETDGGSCQSYLVVDNAINAPFDKLVLDLVLFDAEGIIARRLAVDVAPLRAGRQSVKVFAIPQLACEGIGRILVNGVLGCTSEGAPVDGCVERIETTSRAPVELIF